MCVVFVYVNANPATGGYKLILASNRDEFYKRPTSNAKRWTHAYDVYGGIDMEPGREGGTWLAISGYKNVFKVGALLNLTGEPKPRNAIGRGMIVSDYVTFDDVSAIETYNRDLLANCTQYSAFSFLSIEIDGTRTTPAKINLCSNVPVCLRTYSEGKCYGFGNSLPEVPFEKVRQGVRQFQTIVDNFEHENELVASLQNLLKCRQKCWPDAELQRRAPNWGEHLSALNVDIPDEGYGSRTHTVILIDGDNRMSFIEETLSLETGNLQCTRLQRDFF